MFFIFGYRFMGKVDQVPGYFHVATKFFHVNYLPLIPSKSYIVLSQTGKNIRGIPIPLSWKSVGIAWARSISGLTAVICFIVTLFMLQSSRPEEWAPVAVACALGVVGFALTKSHRSVTHANVDRVRMLARLAGMNERGIAQLRNSFAQGFEVVQPGAPSDIPLAHQAPLDIIPLPDDAPITGMSPIPDFSAPCHRPLRPRRAHLLRQQDEIAKPDKMHV